MRGKSIRFYFFASITTALVASVLVMGMLQTYIATTYFRADKQRIMREVAQAVATATSSGQLADEGAFASLIYMTQITDAAVFITSDAGTVRYSVGQNAPPPGFRLPAVLMGQVADGAAEYSDTGTLGGVFAAVYYTIAMPLQDAEGHPSGYVFASADSSGMQAYMFETLSTYIMSAALVLLISSLLALALANRMVIPIRRVSGAARRFGEGDYSTRVPVEGDDEMTRLAVTFNNMADSIEATDISRRSFMGNIAHELRTPMTTIKGFIDGMLDGTIPTENRDKYLKVVSSEVGRLSRLTKNMLDISRLEAGEYSPSISNFDLCDVLTSVLLSAEQRLEDKGVTVQGLEACRRSFVQADADFVHQVVFNLVDNAIKFCSEGGTVTVAVKREKKAITASIRNSGAGLAPDALPYIFDRFYKADKSRSGDTHGAGLGLHISKVLLGLMNGHIWAESEEGEYTEFLFTLPAGTAPKKPVRSKK